MSEISIVILMVAVLILFKMWKLPQQIDIISTGLLMSGVCFYIARTVGDVFISQIFMILTFLGIFMILFLEILIYINKIMK